MKMGDSEDMAKGGSCDCLFYISLPPSVVHSSNSLPSKCFGVDKSCVNVKNSR